MSERHSKYRVLIADDYPLIANTLAAIFNENGYEATAVYSGEQAVEIARTLKPETFISDIAMTGMTGIEAAIQIKKLELSCGIVLYSGQPGATDLLAAQSAEVRIFELLDKPVHPQVFLARLDAARRQACP